MRKILSVIAALLFAGLTVMWADSATPDPIKMKQPDGSTITLRLHGDEFYNWFTSEDGKTLYTKDASGWWRPAGKPTINRSSVSKANNLRAQRDDFFRKRSKSGLGLGWGSNHFLIILVEWKDYKFQEGAKEFFTNSLGQTGFTGNGCIGSAKDYYTDASYGDFTPNFDVYGPVTVDRNHTDWPVGDDEKIHSEMARVTLKAAIDLLDETIDFSIYDNDKDGYVDNVYMFYPGYAASSGAQNAIWPHASSTYKMTGDNVAISSYGCSSELMKTSGTTFVGIGTFCHEFGHVIGLPDLYDTDYGENGSARHPSSWNLMAGGNHNSNGCIPARMSTIERYILGYLKDDDIVDLSTPGNKTLQTLSAKKFYKLPVPTNEGEFFVPEVRDGLGWDQTLPGGMIIYHVDQSQNNAAGMTAKDRWDNWSLINGYEEHPCDYIVCPDEDAYGGKAVDYYQLWVFPTDQWEGYYYKVYNYTPTAWNGTQPFNLTNINYASGQATFTVAQGERNAMGTVTDATDSAPIKDAIVVIEPQSSQAPGFGQRVVSLAVARRNSIGEATTDENGKYKIVLPDGSPENLTISVFAKDYLATQENVSGSSIVKDFSLTSVYNGIKPSGFTKANFPLNGPSRWGWSSSTNYTAAVRYSAEELKDHVGSQLTEIAFASHVSGEEVYVIVDFGKTQRVLAKKVDESTLITDIGRSLNWPANAIDVSQDNIIIPANTDVYIGYAIKNATGGYAVYTDGTDNARAGDNYMFQGFSTTAPGGDDWIDPITDWSISNFGNVLVGFKLLPKISVNPNAKLTDMGLCYIDMPTTLTAGTSLPLKLVYSKANMPYEVEWYYDGAKIDSQYVTLESGKHTLRATLKYSGDKQGYSVDVKFTVQ